MNLIMGLSLAGRGWVIGTRASLAPVNTVAPALDEDEPAVGGTITCGTGTWDPAPSGYLYQWQRDTVDIGGATTNQYEVVAADIGAVLRCRVRATNGQLSDPAFSNETWEIPQNYEFTAFLSNTGNDETGEVNDPELPFATAEAARQALGNFYSAPPPEHWTLRLLTDFDSWTALRIFSEDVPWVLRPHGATRRVLSELILHGSIPADVELINVEVTVAHSTGTGGGADLCTLTGDADTIIGELTLTSDEEVTHGTAGQDNSTVNITGDPDNPPQPASQSPPLPGDPGGDADANGGDGQGPVSTNLHAWNITLRGTMTISQLTGAGLNGGDGADGGPAGAATGGQGGQGGNADAAEDPEDGGQGGDGGDATANGGDALAPGAGGNGSTVSKESGVTISASTLTKGLGGAEAFGGPPGIPTAGSGGVGGGGVNGGSDGPTGNMGVASAEWGSNAPAGADGADGQIINI